MQLVTFALPTLRIRSRFDDRSPPLLQLGRSEDVLLRQLTASILCELASVKSCKEELIRNGGPTRLLPGMARQIHRRVARPAMHALEELSELTDLAPLLIDAGAAPVLIALTASTDEHLGRWAASALAKLFTPRTTAALLRQGALGAIFVAATVPDRAMQLPALPRSLVAPLTFSSTYVPYLPTTLLHPSDAVTLINDSTSPYAARAIRAQFGAIL